MNRYGGDVILAEGLHIPDLVEQLFLGENVVGIFCQEGQEIELLGGEGLLLAVYKNAAGGLVDLDPADLDDLVGLGLVI